MTPGQTVVFGTKIVRGGIQGILAAALMIDDVGFLLVPMVEDWAYLMLELNVLLCLRMS